MIDPEVIRLRRLRNTALRARAITMVLNGQSESQSVLSRIAPACWRISRAVSGKLTAHPYLTYQRGPSHLRTLYNSAIAAFVGAVARHRKDDLAMYSRCLQSVARELDDTRALTWSPTLSDTLGRSQSEIRLLLKEIAFCARMEAGSRIETAARVDVGAGSHGNDASGVAVNWPHVAI